MMRSEKLKTHLSHQKREALGSKVADVILLVRQKFTVKTDLEKVTLYNNVPFLNNISIY